MTGPIQIAVCGPSDCTPGEDAAARRIGELLADRGAVVFCGGGPGVMAAVAAGVRSRGGVVIGIRGDRPRRGELSAAGPEGVADPASGAAVDLTAVVRTGMGEARNAIIVSSADAVIAVGGSWGTLSEIALAIRAAIPVVTLDGWRIGDPAGAPVGGPLAGPVAATSAEHAVDLALAMADAASDVASGRTGR